MSNFRRYVPSLSKLYISLRHRSKEFIRENTLHGFPYFANLRRPFWERIAWFVCTIASIGIAIAIILTILEGFRRDPTLVGLDTETEDLQTYFPNVILCKEDPNFNFGPYQTDADHYNSMYKWSWKTIKDEPSLDASGKTYSEIFHHAAPNCEDLYHDCTYTGGPISCDKMFRKMLTTRGICCVIEASKISKEAGPWGLSFRTNAYPISVDVLEKNALPPQRDAPPWYYLTSGVTIKMSIQLTYASSGMETLLLGQRKCLLPKENPSYNRCIYQCDKNRILDACNCIPWFLIPPTDNNGECTRRDYDCLIDKKNILMISDCKCYLSCNHTSYKFDMLEYREDNIVEIHMRNWPTVLYKREVRFGWLDLLVSFGGIAGLFIGYSLLTTVELGYYFSLRFYCGAVLAEPKKKSNKRVEKVSVPRRRVIRVIDVKKDYYDYVD